MGVKEVTGDKFCFVFRFPGFLSNVRVDNLCSVMLVLIITAVLCLMPVSIAKETRAAAVIDFVAFSTGLSQTTSLPANGSLAFDKVWLNLGDGYDNSTGEFTTPRAGTYVFFFNGLANSAGTLQLALYRNGRYEISSYAHNTGNFASTTNSVVLTLAVGDVISIQSQGTVANLYGAIDEVYTTFSGHILYGAPVNTTVSPI